MTQQQESSFEALKLERDALRIALEKCVDALTLEESSWLCDAPVEIKRWTGYQALILGRLTLEQIRK